MQLHDESYRDTIFDPELETVMRLKENVALDFLLSYRCPDYKENGDRAGKFLPFILESFLIQEQAMYLVMYLKQ
jgi:hypothetical protein